MFEISTLQIVMETHLMEQRFQLVVPVLVQLAACFPITPFCSGMNLMHALLDLLQLINHVSHLYKNISTQLSS